MSLLVPARRRSVEELELGIAPEEAERSLRDIEWIHRNLGGRWTIRRGLLPALAALGPGPLTLLDVGCGTGHAGDDLAAVARRRGLPVESLGIDRLLAHARLAGRGRVVVGDAFRIPLPDRSVDVVFSALFVHHFSDDELSLLLAESARVARRLVAHFDVDRHLGAWALVAAVGPLAFRSPVTLSDAKASVLQAYTPRELGAIASGVLPGARVDRVGLLGCRLLWHRP